MAPPPWLPPVNSHDHYSVSEVLIPESPRYRTLSSNSVVFQIKTIVSVKFKSDENNTKQRTSERWRYEKEFNFGCLVNSSSLFSARTGKKMIPDVWIPFQIDRDKVVEKIRNFARCMRKRTPRCYNVLRFRLEITKEVKIPDHELEAWNSWYYEKVLIDPSFEYEYKREISRPRTYQELIYGTTLIAFKATSESCIDGLKKVNLDDDDGSRSRSPCAICLEELQSDENGLMMATILPCSHVFHGDCILKWLKVSHACPVCRFVLPSVSNNYRRRMRYSFYSSTIFICSFVLLAAVLCAAVVRHLYL